MAVDRALLDEFVEANQGIRGLIIEAIEDFFQRIDTTDAKAVANLLEEFLPSLIEQYGGIASVIALDFFETSRQLAGVTSSHVPQVVLADLDHLGPDIGWAVDPLFSANPSVEDAISRVVSITDKAVKEHGTNTIIENASSDPAKPRFARVPVGDTCKFCRMLASRGFVYSSEFSAFFQGQGKRFHDWCDCAIVADWDVNNPRLEGYDPDALEHEWRQATKDAENSNDINDVMKASRKPKNGKEPEKEKPSVWDDLGWVENQLRITEGLQDSPWRTQQLTKLRAAQKRLS